MMLHLAKMTSKYQKLALADETDATASITTVHQSSRFAVSKNIFLCLLALTIFNAGLAIANMHYAMKWSQLLQQCKATDIQNLRRIDPFNGNNIPASPGKYMLGRPRLYVKYLLTITQKGAIDCILGGLTWCV